MTTISINTNDLEPQIFRRVAFPLATFEYLKEVQRNTPGIPMNNNQVLAMILREHRQLKQVNNTSGEHKNGTEFYSEQEGD